MSRGSLGSEKLLLKKEDIAFRGNANSSTPKGRVGQERGVSKPSVFFKNNCSTSAEQIMNGPLKEKGEEKREIEEGICTVEEEQTQSRIHTELVDTRDPSAEEESEKKSEA